VTMALGVAGASAATVSGPNPGLGNPGLISPSTAGLITGATNTTPKYGSALNVDGSQTANVPILAWVGENVRLTACDPNIYPGVNSGAHPIQTADWSTELWTGDQADQSTPQFDGFAAGAGASFSTGSNGFFGLSAGESDPVNLAEGKGCTTATVKELHAGLAEFQLDVNSVDYSIYSQQFIVIWMTANTPVISESSVNSLDYPGGSTVAQLTSKGITNATGIGCFGRGSDSSIPVSGPTNCTGFLGDPSGNGMFNPTACYPTDLRSTSNVALQPYSAPCNNGLVNIRVTGSFPVEDQPPATTNLNKFGSIDGGANPGTINLPSQWAALAGLLADSSTTGSSPGSNPSLWDIHGGPTNADSHPVYPTTNNTPCPADIYGGVVTPTLDAVNNCLGGTDNYSRVFADVTSGPAYAGPGVGPYDEEVPNETLLSDGRLNADDAPMPALPVWVNIAPNKGGTDLGGVGGLTGASKALIYSHDFNGASNPGNLYNPFYSEYIPSTNRAVEEASGVSGVYTNPSGDNFPGFNNGNTDAYTFWNALDGTSQNTGGATACLEGSDNPFDARSSFYYGNPDQDQQTSVLVYTDERGEAFVTYNPGDEFFLDGLIKPDPPSHIAGGTNPAGPITIDQDGACDLQPLLNQTIGTSAITATAQYPYQGVPYPNIPTSNTVTKTVKSLWNKTLTAYPKGNAGSGTDSSYVSDFVTTATNINGQPFAGEYVCFNVQSTTGSAPGVSPFAGQIENGTGTVVADTSDEGIIPAIEQPFENYYCVESNDLGEAGIEVSGSNPGVDVSAFFWNEQIFRDLSTTLGSSSTSSGTPPSGPTVTPAASTVASTGSAGAGSSSQSSTSSSSSTPPVGAVVAPLASVHAANVLKVSAVHLSHSHGKYTVTFKLSSSTGSTASITIKAYKANGKLIRTYHLVVATNKTVKVSIGGAKVSKVTVIA
jgi:hypothetical protein